MSPHGAHAGEREGVLFTDARALDFFHGEQPFLRLGFSYHDSAELDEAARRMARALIRTRSTSATMQTENAAQAAKQTPQRRDAGLNGKGVARPTRSQAQRG